MSSVSFESKIRFSASRDLSFTRSKCFRLPKTENQSDAWSARPPDFSVRLYSRLTDSQRQRGRKNANEAQPTKAKRAMGKYLPAVVRRSLEEKEVPKFITSHRPADALESELMFVRTGKFPSDRYRNPRPHDFRPLDGDLPEISAAYERDPGNLNLKRKHLDTLRTSSSETGFSSRDAGTQMDTYKPPGPKWDSKLILPPLPWPPKSASYTRHRRRRGAYSAFLDRVEEKLSRSWKNMA